MTKVTLNNVGSLIDATTAQATINANNDTIETAFDNTLSRDGTTPNQMLSSIDMNSHHLVNLPAPVSGNEPLRLSDANILNGGGTIANLPTGGTTNQGLLKNSNADYDFKYGNVVSSVGLSLPADFTVTNSPVVATGTLTATYANTPTGSGGFVRAVAPAINTPALTTPQLVGSSSGVTTIQPAAVASGVWTVPAGTDDFLGRTSVQAVTNKSIDTANGNTLSVNSVAMTANTGTGAVVRATTPTLVTPVLGAATGTSLNLSGLTASSAVATDGSKNLVSVTNTGSGNNVLATSPTLVTPTLGAATATTINGVTIDNNGWTVSNPTITAASGTFTSVSSVYRTKTIGKLFFFNLKITITTAGTAASGIICPIGFTPTDTFAGGGKETAINGFQVNWQTTGSNFTITKYDNTTIIANGAVPVISGVIELP